MDPSSLPFDKFSLLGSENLRLSTLDSISDPIIATDGQLRISGINPAAEKLFCVDPGEAIDLVLLDMIMPEMDGAETFQRLRHLDPDVRVLIASEFSKEKIATTLLKAGALDFISKPFRIQELSKKIAANIKHRPDSALEIFV